MSNLVRKIFTEIKKTKNINIEFTEEDKDDDNGVKIKQEKRNCAGAIWKLKKKKSKDGLNGEIFKIRGFFFFFNS